MAKVDFQNRSITIYWITEEEFEFLIKKIVYAQSYIRSVIKKKKLNKHGKSNMGHALKSAG